MPKATFWTRTIIAGESYKLADRQEIPESVQATVNAINAELRVKPEEIHPD